MVEHVLDFIRRHASQRKRRKVVLREKINCIRFMTPGRCAAHEITKKKQFIRMERDWWVSMPVAIINRRKLSGMDLIPGLFAYFPHRRHAWRISYIGPPARQRPAAILRFPDQE